MKKVMESTQKIVHQIKDENVSQAIGGLWFDCSLFLPGFSVTPAKEMIKEDNDNSHEQANSLFNKIIYVFKREVFGSTVKDHQNSLIYNNRDNSLISEFFFKLGNLILDLDEICLSDLIIRMDKFQEETFECIYFTALKLHQMFRNDINKVFEFFNIKIKMKENCMDQNQFAPSLLHSLEFSFEKIMADYEIPYVQLATFITEKMKLPFDQTFRDKVETFSYGRSSEKISDNARAKVLTDSSIPIDNNLYEASIQERHVDFIRQNILLIVDSNCMIRTQEFFGLISHLCSFFRLHLGVPCFLEFLDNFRKSFNLPKGLNMKVLPINAWRSFCYLSMVVENADIHLNVLKLFPMFVRHNFLAFEAFLASKYFDRTMYLTATVTTVAREVSLSSHSSFADALKSFMTEDEDISDIQSPLINQDQSNRHLENFNLTFFRKFNFCFEDLLLEKAKLFNEVYIIEVFQYIVNSILTINLTKGSFKMIVYLLEFSVDFFCRKSSSEQGYYQEGLNLIDTVLDLSNDVSRKNEERDFKERFRNLKDSREISLLMSSYFKSRIALKMVLETGCYEMDRIQVYFSTVVYAGSAYMNLMIGVFESAVKTLLYKLSIKNSHSEKNIQAWQAILKLILHIKSLVLSNEERMDGTDESLSKLEDILLEISNNIKINPTTIHCDIILVNWVD